MKCLSFKKRGLLYSHLILHSTLTILCTSLIFSNQVHAASISLYDWDGTTVENRKERKGTFQATFKLFRIDQRETTLQNVPETPKVIEVSHQELHLMKDYLGKGPGQYGDGGHNRTLTYAYPDGLTINPAAYFIVDPDSYESFRTHEDSKKNNMLAQYEDALVRGPADGIKGIMYPYLVARLSNKDSAKGTGFLTARDQAGEHEKLMTRWKSEGRIAETPNSYLMHHVSNPEYLRYGNSILERKIGVLKEIALTLEKAPLSDADLRLDRNGKELVRIHAMVFAEDDQDIVKAARKLFRELSQSKTVPVKFVLINTGTEEEVRELRQPRYAVFMSDGETRPAKPLEIAGEPTGMTADILDAMLNTPNCQRLLTENSKTTSKKRKRSRSQRKKRKLKYSLNGGSE